MIDRFHGLAPRGLLESWSTRVLLFLLLFLIFTPFETDGSLGATYAMTFGVFLLTWLAAPQQSLRTLLDPGLALILPLGMVLHSLVVNTGLSAYPILLCVSVLSVTMLVGIAGRYQDDFVTAGRAVLIVNLIALLVQLAAFKIGGQVLDIHQMIFPMSPARIELEAGGVIRLTGLQIEPGNYSNWMALLIICLRLVCGRFSLVEYICAASIALTFSATGVVFVVLLMAWMAADILSERSARKWVLVIVFFAAVLTLAASFNLVDFYEARFLGRDDGSVLYRVMSLDAYDYLSLLERIVGFGFAQEICDGCHFNDLGFGPNLAMRGGVLMLLCFIPWAHRALQRRSLVTVVFGTCIVFLAKAPQYSMAAWLVLLLMSGVRSMGAASFKVAHSQLSG